jgi:hypothetical protein
MHKKQHRMYKDEQKHHLQNVNLKGCHTIQGPKKHKDKKTNQTHWDYI